MLWDLMQGIYEQDKIPTEWRYSVIIPMYTEKGVIQVCGNCRRDKADVTYYAALGKDP